MSNWLFLPFFWLLEFGFAKAWLTVFNFQERFDYLMQTDLKILTIFAVWVFVFGLVIAPVLAIHQMQDKTRYTESQKEKI